MCGRARSLLSGEQIECLLKNILQKVKLHPSVRNLLASSDVSQSELENKSPGMNFNVVYYDEHTRQYTIESMKWGLVPSYMPDPVSSSDHYKMFNARIETITEKKSFKNLIFKSRGLVIIDGFYEWLGEPGKKTPYYVHLEDKPMILPVLYTTTKTGMKTFTILTCDSSDQIRWLHDRQPVILTEFQAIEWLDIDKFAPHDVIRQLMASKYDNFKICAHEVTRNVTNPKYQGTDCSAPVATIIVKTPKKITSFFNTQPKKGDGVISSPEKKSSVGSPVMHTHTSSSPVSAGARQQDSSGHLQQASLPTKITSSPTAISRSKSPVIHSHSSVILDRVIDEEETITVKRDAAGHFLRSRSRESEDLELTSPTAKRPYRSSTH